MSGSTNGFGVATTSERVRLYLDANILIYAMETADSRGMRARRCLQQIELGEVEGVTSELTLAEVLRGGNAARSEALSEGYLELLSSASPIGIVPVDRNVLISAARLQFDRRIELPDAIHLATAIITGCALILTEDKEMPVAADLEKRSLTDWIPVL